MNKIQLRHFVQENYSTTDEWKVVRETGKELFEFFSQDETIAKIEIANLPGKKSSEVQNVFLEFSKSIGFKDESEGLFSDYKNKRLRPDYYKPLPNGTGILFEVERGKTNQNNMDFLDFWKCHICKHAHYLFLVVPNELRQNSNKKVVGKPFKTVVSHMESLFIPENYTNVRGMIVFGY